MQTRAINGLDLKSHLIASSGMWEAQELCVRLLTGGKKRNF